MSLGSPPHPPLTAVSQIQKNMSTSPKTLDANRIKSVASRLSLPGGLETVSDGRGPVSTGRLVKNDELRLFTGGVDGTRRCWRQTVTVIAVTDR